VPLTVATHAVWSVVKSEDGKAWNVLLTWSDGRRDRILRFETQEAAEAWLQWDNLFMSGLRPEGLLE
jgi:hypothetical protein